MPIGDKSRTLGNPGADAVREWNLITNDTYCSPRRQLPKNCTEVSLGAEDTGALYQWAFKDIRIRGDPFLKQGASPNPSTRDFFNMSVCDSEFLRSKQLANIL